MRKTLTLLSLATALCGCGGPDAPKRVAPLPAGVDVTALADCTVPASFTVEDIDWDSRQLALALFNEDLYDAAEIHGMKAGDTLVYNGDTIIVSETDETDGYLTVNGGIEEGGAYLQAHEGGTYRGTLFDDHSVYSPIGKTTVPLADGWVIIDCRENPGEPSDTLREGQQAYLEALAEYRRQFSPLDTRVRIRNGKVTHIERHWIP